MKNPDAPLEPWAFRIATGELVEVTQEHIDAARRLIAEGWYQTSRKYRSVARLPPGKTGVEALIDADRRREYPHPHLEKWARGMGEGHAGDHYLCCYAPPEHRAELDIPTFAAYRRLGGQHYHQFVYITEMTIETGVP